MWYQRLHFSAVHSFFGFSMYFFSLLCFSVYLGSSFLDLWTPFCHCMSTQFEIRPCNSPSQQNNSLFNIYTLCLQKRYLTVDHNFRRCISICKNISLTGSQGNSVCSYYRTFHLTLSVLLYYLAKFKHSNYWLHFYSYRHNYPVLLEI